MRFGKTPNENFEIIKEFIQSVQDENCLEREDIYEVLMAVSKLEGWIEGAADSLGVGK